MNTVTTLLLLFVWIRPVTTQVSWSPHEQPVVAITLQVLFRHHNKKMAGHSWWWCDVSTTSSSAAPPMCVAACLHMHINGLIYLTPAPTQPINPQLTSPRVTRWMIYRYTQYCRMHCFALFCFILHMQWRWRCGVVATVPWRWKYWY